MANKHFFSQMQDLNSEIDIFALQGEEGIRKKMEEVEKCESYEHSLRPNTRKHIQHGWAITCHASTQIRRALVMCEKQKCTNVELVVKVVEKAMSYRGSHFFLKPELALTGNGHFVNLLPDKNLSPEFAEFFILTFKKAGKFFHLRRLENDIFGQFLRNIHLHNSYYKTIEMFLLLLRYGVGLGDRSMKPERIMGMLLKNLVIVVIQEEHGDAVFGDLRKAQEMVDMVKKSFLFNCDFVRRYFEEYLLNDKCWLRCLTDFERPKSVEEFFQILESRGLVNRMELFQIPSLKQMCKVNIRGILNQKWELPEGIDKLEGIPQNLKCYLDLMTD